MKKTILVFAILFSAVAHAEKAPMPMADVLAGARFKQPVLVRGSIVKQLDFDTYVIQDNSEKLLANFKGVKQRLGVGDTLIVYGMYLGKGISRSAKGDIDVKAYAFVSDEAASKALIEKYGSETAALRSVSTPLAIDPPKTIESRLRELDELKTKNLVTDQEYKEQRKRILDGI